MAARKGRGRQAVRNGRSGFPGWGYAVIGVLAGAILMAIVMRGSLFTNLRTPTGPQANPQATAQRGSEPGVLEPAPGESTPKKPQYDFYSVLSEKEVRIPDAEISAQAKAEQQQAATPAPTTTPASTPGVAVQNVTAAPAEAVEPASGGNGYLLQVGAFPDPATAEAQKAKLALQGFVANVQTVNVGGQTYHRVRLGPFRSATELESTKQKLAAAGIPAIALKEGK
ncbi:SPOR domain-containing protein [Rhodanobacter sp. UC4451_H18]